MKDCRPFSFLAVLGAAFLLLAPWVAARDPNQSKEQSGEYIVVAGGPAELNLSIVSIAEVVAFVPCRVAAADQ